MIVCDKGTCPSELAIQVSRDTVRIHISLVELWPGPASSSNVAASWFSYPRATFQDGFHDLDSGR